MNAIPVSIGRFFNSSVIASSPPADAPIATIGNDPFLIASSLDFLVEDLALFPFSGFAFFFITFFLIKDFN